MFWCRAIRSQARCIGQRPFLLTMSFLCLRSKMRRKITPLLMREKAVLKQWILDGAEWPDEVVLEPM